MINFKLDSEEKKISVEMKLKGEVDVIYFEIGRYEIFKEDEKLLASDIADALKHILSMRKGAVVSEYTIRSLKFGIKKKKD